MVWPSAETLGRLALLALATTSVSAAACRSAEPGQGAPSASALPTGQHPVPSTAAATPSAPALPSGTEIRIARAVYGAPPPPPRDAQGRPVQVNATLGEIAVTGGNIANAPRVVAGMRNGFRRCYERFLQTTVAPPKSLHVSLQVDEHGEVVAAKAAVGAPSRSGLMVCVEGRARAAQFDIPEGEKPATIKFGVTFSHEPAK